MQMNCIMRKTDVCICENKGADQLCNNCTTDIGQKKCVFPVSRPTLFFPATLNSLSLKWPRPTLIQNSNPPESRISRPFLLAAFGIHAFRTPRPIILIGRSVVSIIRRYRMIGSEGPDLAELAS